MPDHARVPLPGSERGTLPGAEVIGPVQDAEPIEVTVFTRRRAPLPREGGVPVRISRAELRQFYGSDPVDQKLTGYALSRFGLTATRQEPGTRRMTVTGTAAAFRGAFGVELTLVRSPRPSGAGVAVHRYRTGGLLIPAELDGIVEAVLGLDDRPQARCHALRADPAEVVRSYTPSEVADIYRFPAGTDGTGQHLALLNLGGGFDQGDLDSYFASLGLPSPQVNVIGVDGAGRERPGRAEGEGEVTPHIEIAGATAPGATQWVYRAANSDRGFTSALIEAVQAAPTPTAVSISWGQPEEAWTVQARAVVQNALADATALGVTVCAASGNHGSSDGVDDGRPHVDFPASSPHALACGGTSLRADPASGVISSETVWNSERSGATGGGVSEVFAVPEWQSNVGVPPSYSGGTGRGVPDVAGNADPATGYQVYTGGQASVVGGTSAVAPLWAGLICRMAQATGQSLGMVQPRWYGRAEVGETPPGFRGITSGNNGAYRAGPGWNACTGLGTPQGDELLAGLAGGEPAERGAGYSITEDALAGGYEGYGPVGNGGGSSGGAGDSVEYEDSPYDDVGEVAGEALYRGESHDPIVVESPIPYGPPEPAEEDDRPRWILAQAFEVAYPGRRVERAFRADTHHLVIVQIGPERVDMLRARGGPPIDELLPGRGDHALVIVFFPPSGEVQARPVVLPRTGSSAVRAFTFRTGPAGQDVKIQISVLYQDRVLQSATLRGPVLADPSAAAPDAGLEFTLAVIRPGMSGLESRERFDTAVIVTHTPEGKPTAVGVHEEKVSRFDDDGIERAAGQITTILTDLADNPDRYAPPLDSPANVDLLRRLAFQGVLLYEAMGQHVVAELASGDLNAIQVVVSDPNDFIPVELVYDLPAPTASAGLCPNWQLALRDGRCDPVHHAPDPDDPDLMTVVCPLGFWALSKIIERQVIDRGQPLLDLQGMDFAVRSEPTAERMHLPGLTSALFAASTRVDSVQTGLTTAVLSTLEGLLGDSARGVSTWADWVREVRSGNPALLVLLSHTEKVQGTLALEIGSQDFRMLAQITPSLVKAVPDAAPVVLLLGCDTAVAEREYQSFAARFRDKGAALVVGTIAAVLGEHAAPVAQALATALHDAATRADAGPGTGTEQATFGVTMRDIRRKLLGEGELMALCLATFGDADWRLTGN